MRRSSARALAWGVAGLAASLRLAAQVEPGPSPGDPGVETQRVPSDVEGEASRPGDRDSVAPEEGATPSSRSRANTPSSEAASGGARPDSDAAPGAPPSGTAAGANSSDPAAAPSAGAAPSLAGQGAAGAGSFDHSLTSLSRPADAGAFAPSRRDKPLSRTLGIEVAAGVSLRLDAMEAVYDDREPFDLMFGAGLMYGFSRTFALGVAFQRLGLGGEQTEESEEGFSVQRDLDAIWLSARLHPIQGRKLRVYGQLDGGAAWQRLTANGSRGGDFVNPPEVFTCSGSAGPVPAVGARVGIDVDIDRHLAFMADVGAARYWTSDASVDGCVAGAEDTMNGSARLGFAYRFGLD